MTSIDEDLLPRTRRALLHRIAVAQRDGRAPSLVAAVRRQGRTAWSGARTCVEGHAPDADTQYRIGSITKTFTAVLVLRLRDEGLIDLDDPLEKHLPGTGAGGVTVFQLLGHSAGLGAEAPAPWWERTPGSLRPEIADVLGDRPQPHPAGHRHHYSNPGYTLLGSLVEAVRGVSWEEALRREILEPLDMHRTTSGPVAPHAGGWAVHPWADVMLSEPAEDLGIMAPAGQLWSTAADLLRFAAFLTEGDDRVLSASSVREMRMPAAPAETGGSGYGLGLQIVGGEERVLFGHSGSLPGFVMRPLGQRGGRRGRGRTRQCHLGAARRDGGRRTPGDRGRSRATDPGALASAAGGGRRTARADRDLALGYPPGHAEADGGPGPAAHAAGRQGRGAAFTYRPDGTWTGQNDYYAGETLRVVRKEDGSVDHLDLGSFVFTREPYEAGAAVPGGVDAEGWRGLGS